MVADVPATYTVHVPDSVLDDLRARLEGTRWPDAVSGAGWDYGTNEEYLRSLIADWQSRFDWREQEARLNRYDHFHLTVDHHRIHYILAESSSKDAIPLVLLHGWPSSFVQMLDIIPLLTPHFTVIVPSLPGYGFSSASTKRGMSTGRIAELMCKLMKALGYERFAARGSDLGAGVLQQIALQSQSSLLWLHLSGTNPYIGNIPSDLSPAEQSFVERAQRWNQTEMAYAMLHPSKPQTVAYALNDSPAGLASWIVEKFWRWSDDRGDLSSRFSSDQLLTNIMIYWVTGTINSSMRLYYETARADAAYGKVQVPAAFLMSDKDMFETPREWVERQYTVARWTPISSGGHFLEWEEPRAVAADIIAFGDEMRSRKA